MLRIPANLDKILKNGSRDRDFVKLKISFFSKIGLSHSTKLQNFCKKFSVLGHYFLRNILNRYQVIFLICKIYFVVNFKPMWPLSEVTCSRNDLFPKRFNSKGSISEKTTFSKVTVTHFIRFYCKNAVMFIFCLKVCFQFVIFGKLQIFTCDYEKEV